LGKFEFLRVDEELSPWVCSLRIMKNVDVLKMLYGYCD